MKINKPNLLWQLTFEGSWPSAITFLGSNRRIAAANQDGQIYIWDLPAAAGVPVVASGSEKSKERKAPDHAPTRRLEGHTNGVTRLVATADGKQLASASLDHTVRLWKTDAPATGTADAVMDGEQRRNKSKRDKKDESLNDPGVTVETQTAAHVLPGHTDWVLTLGINRAENRMISGDAASRVIVWNLADGKEVTRWSGLPWNWIQAAALTDDGKMAVVSESRYKRDDFDVPTAALRLYDVAEGKEKLDFLKVNFPKLKVDDTSYGGSQLWRKFMAHGLIACDISPDQKLAALAQGGETDNGKIHLMDMETGKLVRDVSGHQSGATDVKFSADGKYVLSVGRDTTLRICQTEDGKEVAALGTPRGGQFKDWFAAVAISPDQQRVAVADIAGMVFVWSLNSEV